MLEPELELEIINESALMAMCRAERRALLLQALHIVRGICGQLLADDVPMFTATFFRRATSLSHHNSQLNLGFLCQISSANRVVIEYEDGSYPYNDS